MIGLKIEECEKVGMSFQEVVDTVEAYIAEQHTYFVLENLETLRKNGRLSGLKAMAASVLNIKPVMGSTPKGEIQQLAQMRGMRKATNKMAEILAQEAINPAKKILAISHCNCPERAEQLKHAIMELIPIKDCILVDTRGISSMYANDGGVIAVI